MEKKLIEQGGCTVAVITSDEVLINNALFVATESEAIERLSQVL